MSDRLERFAEAFDCGAGSCRRTCACGKTYYNPDSTWGFDEGELEELEKSGATSLEWSVGLLAFEGTYYVPDCTCWHARAERIMAFLDGHREQIAKYLNGEKRRLTMEAERMTAVEEAGR